METYYNGVSFMDNKSIPTISIGQQYMYIHDVYMLPNKMAISHSSHLFVPVTFVFCLLLFIHVSDSYSKQPILFYITILQINIHSIKTALISLSQSVIVSILYYLTFWSNEFCNYIRG